MRCSKSKGQLTGKHDVNIINNTMTGLQSSFIVVGNTFRVFNVTRSMDAGMCKFGHKRVGMRKRYYVAHAAQN